jgi:hypothetical protein
MEVRVGAPPHAAKTPARASFSAWPWIRQSRLGLRFGPFTNGHSRTAMRGTNDPFDVALRLTFASATKTLGAICLLTEQGYGADAMKLCRSLFESMLVAYWAAFVADSAWVTTRMNEHQQFASLILIEVLEKHPGWLPEGERVQPTDFAIAQRERLSAQFGTYCEESWWATEVDQRSDGRWKRRQKRSLRTLIDELLDVPALEGRLWQKANREDVPTPFVEQMLDIPNRFNNQVLHHNPSGLASYAELAADGYEFDDGPSDKWIAQAQVFAYVAFSLLAQLMIERYAPDPARASTRSPRFSSERFMS